MLATILKALGALGSIAGLLRTLATGLMGLFVFRKGEEAQQGKDKDAEIQVAKDLAESHARNDAAGDDALRDKLRNPGSYG